MTQERTIAEILALRPQAAQIFLRFRMACVGCPMAAFETPGEAARAYGLEPRKVLAALGLGMAGQTERQRGVDDASSGANRSTTHDD